MSSGRGASGRKGGAPVATGTPSGAPEQASTRIDRRAEAQSPEEKPAAAEEPKEGSALQEPVAQPRDQAPRGEDPTLAEMREIAQAERLLESDPAQALELTRAMRTRFEAGYFAEERSYVEVMALQRLGRAHELRNKAAFFLRTYPDGPYTSRVREALARAGAKN